MSNAWQERIEDVLSDPHKARVGALLYYLVMSAVNSPVERKRKRAEDFLLEEAEDHVTRLEEKGVWK